MTAKSSVAGLNWRILNALQLGMHTPQIVDYIEGKLGKYRPDFATLNRAL